MDIAKEKEHVYKQMALLMEERKEITTIYYSWKERLDHLNKLEARGLDQLDIKGYVDYANQMSLTNLDRETRRINHQIKEEEKKFAEPVQTKEKQRLEGEKKETREAVVRKRAKKADYLNTEKIFDYIANVLKEAGQPVLLQDLHNGVQDKYNNEYREGQEPVEIGAKNFQNNLLRRAMTKNPRIQRAHRGFYQYKF